ncbi:response regulator [Ferrimonas futtsuensis]|uniref:response regulator n=1 Tax=Ferrimonas futtsuensis TaxID=364764 RepID=UPI0004286FA7|nr:response regulator [Ferrimonas futtsuensis]
MTLSSVRALLVEGDAAVSGRLTEYLQSLGLTVDLAETAGQALGKVIGRRPDIILMDLNLPGMDGVGLLRSMGEIDEPPPLVLISSKTLLTTQVRSRYPFIVASFEKPIHDLAELGTTIEDAVTPKDDRRGSLKGELSEINMDVFSDPGVAILSQQLIFQDPKLTQAGALTRYGVYSKGLIAKWFVSHTQLTDDTVAGFVAYIPAEDEQVAFVSLMLQTYLNGLRRRRRQDQQIALHAEVILNTLAHEVAASGLKVPIQIGFYTYQSEERKLSLALVGSEIKGYVRQNQHLTPIMLRSGRSLLDSPLMCAAVTRTLEPDSQLVLFGGNSSLRKQLLNDEYPGFQEALIEGGYLQVE